MNLKRRWRKLVCYRKSCSHYRGNKRNRICDCKEIFRKWSKGCNAWLQRGDGSEGTCFAEGGNPEYPVVGYWPNLTKHEEVKEVFEKVKEEFGSLDVLVNNAGISARDPLYDYDPAALRRLSI